MQTILMRAENNGRSKDFYDVFIIYKTRESELDPILLKEAFKNTFEYRGTPVDKVAASEILNKIATNESFQIRWKSFQKKNPYVQDLLFSEAMIACRKLVEISMT